MTTPKPCTSWSQKKRHMSINLVESKLGGRTGTTLCPAKADTYDEPAINAARASWQADLIRLADLDECKQCARKAAKLNADNA